jgi:hypothetical protein
MSDFEVSTTVAISPDMLFGYLADVRHLPGYFPKALRASGGPDEEVSVTLDVDGEACEVAAWVRADPVTRRLQWGVPGYGYQGWLTVSPAAAGCELTVHVQAPDDPDPRAELADTVESIRRAARRAAIPRPA